MRRRVPDMAISDGDTVRVHYTGRLDDDTVFDTSDGHDPLIFTVGAGEVIPGFEDAVRGKEVGESVTVSIPPETAYGPRDEDLVRRLGRDQVQGDIAVGQYIEMTAEDDGAVLRATVVEITDEHVILDFNHFLAGQTLHFELEILGLEDATAAA